MTVYVECYGDEAFARALGIPKDRLRHARGKGEVLNRLDKASAGTVYGIIDEDPFSTQPKKLAAYQELPAYQGVPVDSGLVLLKQKDESVRRLIIVVCPRLEEWLYDRAKECGIDPAEFGLPRNPDELHADARYDKRPKFNDFLARLKSKHPAMQTLAKWLSG